MYRPAPKRADNTSVCVCRVMVWFLNLTVLSAVLADKKTNGTTYTQDAIFVLSGDETLSVKGVLKLSPITSVSDDFTGCFLLFRIYK